MCKLSNINIHHKYMNVFIKSLFYLHLIVTMLGFSSALIVTLAFITLKPNNFLFSIFSLKTS